MRRETARNLSNKDKELLVKLIIDGKKVTNISRETNISRTSLYKWLKIMSSASGELGLRRHWRKISAFQRRKILKLALKYPDYSLRRISKLSGKSLGFVWSCLKGYSLNTKSLRMRHLSAKGIGLYKKLTPKEKLLTIEAYTDGSSVVKICQDFGVSRTSFYNWLQRSLNLPKDIAFENSRPKGKSHWRYIHGVEDAVLSIVSCSPEFSLSKIYSQIAIKHQKIISRSGLYYVLRRLRVNTYRRRILYARSIEQSRSWRHKVLSVSQPINKQYFYLTFLSPPIRARISLFIELLFIALYSFVLGFEVLLIGFNLFNLNQRPLQYGIKEPIGESRNYRQENKSRDIIYLVKYGDTLWGISEEIFDSGYNWPYIAEANSLPDPNYIEIGQELVIPVDPPIYLSTFR